MSLEECFWSSNLNDWKPLFEIYRDELKVIFRRIESKTTAFHPCKQKLFRFLELTSVKDLKVVIWGQDPYPKIDEAQGYSFGCSNVQSSLKNIFEELGKEYSFFEIPKNGDLTKWCKQGVLMANTSLSLNGEKNCWKDFIKILIDIINGCDFSIHVLWGNHAKGLENMITSRYILTSAHPSPLSAHRGFFGNNHFKYINVILRKKNIKEIDWQLIENTRPTTHLELMKIKYAKYLDEGEDPKTHQELKNIVEKKKTSKVEE